TSVTCMARDARQQAASCSFSVTVTVSPKLAATRFVAFGDSITAGTVDPPCHSSSAFTFGSAATVQSAAYERQILIASINEPLSYPSKLQGLLVNRYPAQSPSVVNEGSTGEQVTGPPPTGPTRLPGVLAADAPQVVLIEEGINDISTGDPAGSTAAVVNGLRTMIQQAKATGASVFLANFLPERPGTCRGFRAGVIVPANDQIGALAKGENVPLVDLYAAFGGDASPALIGVDGLHPTAAGYDVIAQAFFDAIRKNLDVTAAG